MPCGFDCVEKLWAVGLTVISSGFWQYAKAQSLVPVASIFLNAYSGRRSSLNWLFGLLVDSLDFIWTPDNYLIGDKVQIGSLDFWWTPGGLQVDPKLLWTL